MEGTVLKTTAGYVARFELPLPHPAEQVWAALTEPARLPTWLAQADIDLVPGGKIQLRFENTGSIMNGRVTEVQPLALFAYLWNSEDAAATAVRWELHPAPDGCLLVLSHTFATCDTLPVMLAGWHTHLELLERSLAGQPAPWPWPRWEELRDHYRDKLGEHA